MKTVDVSMKTRDEIDLFLARQINRNELEILIKEMVTKYPAKIFLANDYTATFRQRMGVKRMQIFEEILKEISEDK